MPELPLGKTLDGKRLDLDLVRLIDSRALIQANREIEEPI